MTEQVLQAVAKHFKITVEWLLRGSARADARAVAATLLQRMGLNNREIGAAIGRSQRYVSEPLARVRDREDLSKIADSLSWKLFQRCIGCGREYSEVWFSGRRSRCKTCAAEYAWNRRREAPIWYRDIKDPKTFPKRPRFRCLACRVVVEDRDRAGHTMRNRHEGYEAA